MSSRPSAIAAQSLAALALALGLGGCQPSSDFRARAPGAALVSPVAEATPRFSWPWYSGPRVEPDLDAAQASARSVRTVLQALPEEERRRLLERWVPSIPAPAPASAAILASGPVAPRLEVDLLAVMRELHARHETRVLALTAFFLGPEPVARARKRLRRAPEHLGVGALSRALRRRERLLLRHVREAERWATLYALAWPVSRSWRVTSRFGPRLHPVLGVPAEHRGVDISMPVGTEVRAPAAGTVTRVREGPINGHWFELDHGAGVKTVYCHLSLVEVKRGQKVAAGDVVARSGDTGRVTGAHLHYQVKLSRAWVDPLGTRASAALVAEPFPLAAPGGVSPGQRGCREGKPLDCPVSGQAGTREVERERPGLLPWAALQEGSPCR